MLHRVGHTPPRSTCPTRTGAPARGSCSADPACPRPGDPCLCSSRPGQNPAWPPPTVTLDEQCDQHLITEPAPGRYVLHDPPREPARTLAEREPRTSRDAVRRLLGHYLHTAPAAARHITSARPDHHRLGRRQPRRPG